METEKQVIEITPEFLQGRPLSYSSLKQFRKSPKHYIQYLTEPYKSSEAMVLGSAIDCLALEPEKFDERFYLFNKPDRRSNAGKAEFDRLVTEAGKRTMIDPETLETAKKCVASLYEYPESARYFENRKRVQETIKWTDRETGLPLIAKIDFTAQLEDELFIIDLKSTADADPNEFNRSIVKFDYILQCGMYLEAFHKKFYKFPHFAFIAVETSEPYNVSINYCDNKFTNMAIAELRGTLKAFKKCLNENLFTSGYEFRLMGLNTYFSVQLPGYYRSPFLGFEDQKDEEA